MLIADDFLTKEAGGLGHREALAVFIVLCAVCGALLSLGNSMSRHGCLGRVCSYHTEVIDSTLLTWVEADCDMCR